MMSRRKAEEYRMSYTPEHREKTRSRIIRSAQRLFNQHGLEGVSIDQIMADAKLTRGGFYRHFSSKSELYAAAMDCFFTNPEWGNRWEGVEVNPERGAVGPQIVRAYLSREHLQNRQDSCPMVALPSDVARSNASVKRAYETALSAMVQQLQVDAPKTGHPTRTEALAIAALCIGGMVVARASDDVAIADEVREAAVAAAMAMGGWSAPDR
jgi:AcrR family transcriptional regulator